MALATVEGIRETGALDHAEDYRIFRLPDEAALDDAVQRARVRAVSWLKTRVPTTYYTGSVTADTDIDEQFRGAEELVSLHFLYLRLKARRVFGTMAPLLQEGSDRFAELIDNELLAQAELMIKPWLDIDTPDDVDYGLPVFVVTTPVDRSLLPTVSEQLQDTLDNANGLIGTVL